MHRRSVATSFSKFDECIAKTKGSLSKNGVRHTVESLFVEAQQIHCATIWAKLSLSHRGIITHNTACFD